MLFIFLDTVNASYLVLFHVTVNFYFLFLTLKLWKDMVYICVWLFGFLRWQGGLQDALLPLAAAIALSLLGNFLVKAANLLFAEDDPIWKPSILVSGFRARLTVRLQD